VDARPSVYWTKHKGGRLLNMECVYAWSQSHGPLPGSSIRRPSHIEQRNVTRSFEPSWLSSSMILTSLCSSTGVPLTTGPSNTSVDGRFLGVFFSVRTGKRYSTFPDLPSDGTTALDVFEGSVNKERLGFLREEVGYPSSCLYP